MSSQEQTGSAWRGERRGAESNNCRLSKLYMTIKVWSGDHKSSDHASLWHYLSEPSNCPGMCWPDLLPHKTQGNSPARRDSAKFNPALCTAQQRAVPRVTALITVWQCCPQTESSQWLWWRRGRCDADRSSCFAVTKPKLQVSEDKCQLIPPRCSTGCLRAVNNNNNSVNGCLFTLATWLQTLDNSVKLKPWSAALTLLELGLGWVLISS